MSTLVKKHLLESASNIVRFAAIDIGSNAVRLLINSVACEGERPELTKLSLIRVPIRLGRDVFSTGKISDAKSEDITNAMAGFSRLLKAYRVNQCMVCATSAMRDAQNGPQVLDRIKSKSGMNVHIINGETEAQYVFKAGLGDLIGDDDNCLCVDLGGGSCELTIYLNGKVINQASFQIGTVSMLEQKVDPSEFDLLANWLKENTKERAIQKIIGTGGNIRKYLKLSSLKKNPTSLTKKSLKKLYKSLEALTYEQRIKDFGLRSDRADVIVPAGYVFLNILNHVQVDELLVPKLGLVDGIMNKLIEQHLL